MKAAGHELKGLRAYLKTGISKLTGALMVSCIVVVVLLL